jgi:transcriptional regulator CtsR
MHTVNAVGERIDLNTATALVANLLQSGIMDEGAARLTLAAIGGNALRPIPPPARDVLRASILKQLLINLV